jgi:dienelactone hydrolase
VKSYLGIFAVLLAMQSALAAEHSKSAPGPFTVETLDLEWRDPKREREVQAKLYFPKSATNPCPVIVFSHGLGGTRNNYEYLGQHWASHGYVVAHVQHHGSDDTAWRGAARPGESMRAAMNVENAMNRPLDVSFVLDQLTDFNGQDGTLRRRMDLKRVGVAGHSFGAFTTLTIAGQRFGLGARSFADPRVKAAIPMSAPVPRRAPERNYTGITIPIFHFTGTADVSPLNDTSAKDRRVPFDSIQNAPQFLITFQDGDHMIFSGRSTAFSAEKKSVLLNVIRESTTRFWDAWLRDDAAAKCWLTNGGAKQVLGKLGVLEQKMPAPK